MVRFLARIFLAVSLLLPFPFANAQETPISDEDRAFLEMIQRDSFAYFRKFAHPATGLVSDSSSSGSPASIAATGFGCAAFAIAQKHGWIGYRDAYQTVDKIFRTLEMRAANQNGFYYHFLDPPTGKRTWSSEASSIDTALLMAGVLLAGEYFQNGDLKARAEKLYEKVNWPWMLNGTEQMSHGWKPGRGFLPYYWDMYSEHLILLALAAGSPTHPVSKSVWDKWSRGKDEYNGRKIVYSYTGSLFTYQFPHAFIDFRKLRDQNIDYFENSKQATLANREFCIANQNLYPSYSENLWGLSASLGPDGYKAYGAEPGIALHDGTVAPYTVAASIVFTPRESLDMLRHIYDLYKNKIYGEYGFKDAFNLERNWWANDYLGIDEGVVILMLENYLNDGMVWKKFMQLPVIQRWIETCRLLPKTTEQTLPASSPETKTQPVLS